MMEIKAIEHCFKLNKKDLGWRINEVHISDCTVHINVRQMSGLMSSTLYVSYIFIPSPQSIPNRPMAWPFHTLHLLNSEEVLAQPSQPPVDTTVVAALRSAFGMTDKSSQKKSGGPALVVSGGFVWRILTWCFITLFMRCYTQCCCAGSSWLPASWVPLRFFSECPPGISCGQTGLLPEGYCGHGDITFSPK